MPYAINFHRNLTGLAGAHGSDGADGDTPGEAGGAGGLGGAGRAANFNWIARDYVSNAASDLILFTVNLAGGNGGAGGFGGRGAEGSSAFTSGTSGLTAVSTATRGPGGDGGAGGNGGRGGSSTATFSNLAFDLGGSDGNRDRVELVAAAQGGGGGGGVAGATGGGSGPSGTIRSFGTLGDGSLYLASLQTLAGGPGGDGGASGNGAVGGAATVRHAGLSFTGDHLQILLAGTAIGGGGGSAGGHWDRGTGWGAAGTMPGLPADGGDGSAGGAATAVVSGLTIAEATDVWLRIHLLAWGGGGGQGGHGADSHPAYGFTFDETYGPGGTSVTRNYDWADAADGGAGGRGGNATASLTGSSIALGDGADSVEVRLIAVAGDGGAGGYGGTGYPSSSTTTTDGVTQTIDGGAAGLDGAAGAHGVARITMTDNIFRLGGGNDDLLLDLRVFANGEIAALTFARNTFDGGAGTDRLLFGGSTDNPGVLVDALNGTLRIGNSPANVMTGFEEFHGTLSADRFIDGVGNQLYSGVAGADRYEFRRNHGHDEIQLGSGDDWLIVLRRFGTTLDSFEDVLARSTDITGAVAIMTGAASSITLLGVTLADLSAENFLFL